MGWHCLKLSILTGGQAHLSCLPCSEDVFLFSVSLSILVIWSLLWVSVKPLLWASSLWYPPLPALGLFSCGVHRAEKPVDNHTALQLDPQCSGLAKGSEITQTWQQGGGTMRWVSLTHQGITCKFSFEIRRTSWKLLAVLVHREASRVPRSWKVLSTARGLKVARKSPVGSF